MLENKLSDDEIHSIVDEAVNMEIEFVTSALPCGLIGMNAENMTEYVKYCADRLIVALGAPKLYNATQPFEWMTLISLQGKTNFFERRVSEYQKSCVMQSVKSADSVLADNKFSLEADF